MFHVIKDNYPRWLLWPTLIGVLIGNTIEAAADLGGMAAAINLFVPLPIPIIVVGLGRIILALQVLGLLRAHPQCLPLACARAARVCRFRDPRKAGSDARC